MGITIYFASYVGKKLLFGFSPGYIILPGDELVGCYKAFSLGSYHCSFYWILSGRRSSKTPFRFNNMWLQVKDFREL